MKLRLQQQKEIKEATMMQQKREEDWYMKKLDFQKQIGESKAEHVEGGNTGSHATSMQSVYFGCRCRLASGLHPGGGHFHQVLLSIPSFGENGPTALRQ